MKKEKKKRNPVIPLIQVASLADCARNLIPALRGGRSWGQTHPTIHPAIQSVGMSFSRGI